MAQKRKKTTSFQKQKIAQAQYKNEFLRKLRHFIDIINEEEVSSLIPASILDELYINRTHPFKIVVSPECVVPSSIVKEVRETIVSHTRIDSAITVIPGKLEVSLEEFFTLILTISLNLEKIKENHTALQLLKRNLVKFYEGLQDLLNVASKNLDDMLLSLGMFYHDMSKTIYWLKYEFTVTPFGPGNIISINSYKIESSEIIIEETKRTIIRLGYVFPGFGIDWLSLKPSELKIENYISDTPLDVFIQSHAIRRLSERIDCFPIGSVHYNMFQSLKFPNVFHDNNGNILVEFRFFNYKGGYFLLDIIDGKIVIKTFLFVTNNGTPEGQKLERNTGLQKLDKKYLEIDKLSTFMTSDIGSNEFVKSIFVSSGCKCLLDLYEQFHGLSNTSKKFDADFLLKYMDYGKKHVPETKVATQIS
jgi:hypothetical protein